MVGTQQLQVIGGHILTAKIRANAADKLTLMCCLYLFLMPRNSNSQSHSLYAQPQVILNAAESAKSSILTSETPPVVPKPDIDSEAANSKLFSTQLAANVSAPSPRHVVSPFLREKYSVSKLQVFSRPSHLHRAADMSSTLLMLDRIELV